MKHMMNRSLILAAMITAPLAVAADNHDDHEFGEVHHHEKNVAAGPNGGHVVQSAGLFSFEVVVDKQRKARITMLDDHGHAKAADGVEISGIAGERSAPVKLTFAMGEGGVLVSDKVLPPGAHIPMILVVKSGPDAKPVTERFELHVH